MDGHDRIRMGQRCRAFQLGGSLASMMRLLLTASSMPFFKTPGFGMRSAWEPTRVSD